MSKQIMRPKMPLKVIDDFVERSFIRLKQLYPDLQIAGLAERDGTLNWQLKRLARRLGYGELADLLRQCGFEIINEQPAHEPEPAEPSRLSVPSRLSAPAQNQPPNSALLQSALAKLEQLYPEHKIFALDALDRDLKEKLIKLTEEAGLPHMRDFLQPYGYEFIAGNAVQELRSSVIYPPGQEPEIIKSKVQNMLTRLENYYPEHIIPRMIETDHKKLAQNVSALYRWLGYGDTKAMLAAYGFDYQKGENGQEGGRPASDFQPMLEALQAKYQAQPRPTSVGALLFENPEYKAGLKTLNNRAQELFGMTLKQYLRQQGILAVPEEKKPAARQSNSASDMAETAAAVPQIDEQATPAEFFTYTISAKGAVKITAYTGSDERVTVPRWIEGCPVTTIAKGAFEDNKYLTEIIVPDTVSTIQGDAFKDCISLRKARLSNSLSKIVVATFNGCISLQEVNIPDPVAELKDGTFRDSPLETLHIGKGLAAVNTQAFYKGEYNLMGQRVSQRAIWNVDIDPENANLRAAGSCIFSADGKRLLAALGAISSYIVPEGVETIAEGAFRGLLSLTDIVLPESLREIGPHAFAETGLHSVNLGGNVRIIGERAFAYCERLTGAIFSEGLQEIGKGAFASSPIASVRLPASLQRLGGGSFNCLGGHYMNNAQEFYIDENNPYLKADGDAFYTVGDEGLQLQKAYGSRLFDYNRGYAEAYAVAEQTVAIAAGAFENCHSLGRLTLPEGLLTIGDNAFEDCAGLRKIALPASLSQIGAFAFKGTSIARFELPASLTELGPGALITGAGLGWSNQRSALRYIGVDAANPHFYVDKELKALLRRGEDGGDELAVYFGGEDLVSLPEGVAAIAPQAFFSSPVQEVRLPASLVAIGEAAFYNCWGLKRLRVAFQQPENGVDCAVIYLPEPVQDEDPDDYALYSLRNQYMACIRVNDGRIFDFVKYDSLFAGITDPKAKILVAADRLKSAIQLVPVYRDAYLTYLQHNAEQAVNVVVEFDDLAGLNTLAELGVFTGQNIDRVIELANSSRQTDILSYLLNYKNAQLNSADSDSDGDDYEL